MTRARDLASGLAGVRPFAMASGRVTMGNIASGAGVGVTVTFPSGRFTQVPLVSVTGNGGSYVTDGWSTCYSVTTSSAIIVHVMKAGSPAAVDVVSAWTAVQMTSGAANG
jgi:hypothetical protein